MKIDCYLFQGCGVEQALRENVAHALAVEQVHADATYAPFVETIRVAIRKQV